MRSGGAGARSASQAAGFVSNRLANRDVRAGVRAAALRATPARLARRPTRPRRAPYQAMPTVGTAISLVLDKDGTLRPHRPARGEGPRARCVSGRKHGASQAARQWQHAGSATSSPFLARLRTLGPSNPRRGTPCQQLNPAPVAMAPLGPGATDRSGSEGVRGRAGQAERRTSRSPGRP